MKTQNKKCLNSQAGRTGMRPVPTIIAACMLAVFSLSAPAKAQDVSGGFIAGVTSSDLKIDRSADNIMQGKNIYGFEGGLYLKPVFGPFYVRPQLLYDYRMGSVSSSSNEGSSFSTKFTMHSIEIPMLFGLHIIKPVFIEAGPVYNYVLGVTRTYGTNNVELNKNGFGYRVGAGVDLKAIMLHVSYQGITYGSSGSEATFSDPQTLIFGLSLPFGGGK